MDNGDKYVGISSDSGAEVRLNEELAPYTSYGTGGKADAVFFPESAESARLVVKGVKEAGLPFVFLGNGTNVLASDDGYRGAVISVKKLKGITVRGKTLTAMAGDSLADVLTAALYNSLGGWEFLSGIPASVGGAVAMNAGCFGKNIGDYVSYVISVSGIYAAADCGFGYRKSRFLEEGDGVLSVCFDLENVEYDQAENKVGYYTGLRRGRQPKGRSCGSVFKNDGYFAGKVIESAGLKGHRVGKAFVSEKHANFIIAEPGATSRDISRLIEHIKSTVKEKCNVGLTEEIQYLGEFGK
ncbi:MAG: UDP-N-acetylmuramate dehydrogenase [Clostridia bacterium]|nr:UDP-N-acetylmuramate dehydrogenase [Clostridia bacterium]